MAHVTLSLVWIRAFGYSSEDVQMIIESMASQGKEPTFCMGDDIALAVISQKAHLLYDYFKQRFAQVGSCFFHQPFIYIYFLFFIAVNHNNSSMEFIIFYAKPFQR